MKCIGQYSETDRVCELCRGVYPPVHAECVAVTAGTEIQDESTTGILIPGTIITRDNMLDLIPWPGDDDAIRFDVWEPMARYENFYIVRIVDYVFRKASQIVHREHGKVTILKDLSSNYIVIIDENGNGNNGHPGDTHEKGNGADMWFHGWPIGWNVWATWRWVSIVKKCIPSFKIFVGPNAKRRLEQVAGQKLDWIIEDMMTGSTVHEYGTATKYHLHLYTMWHGEIEYDMEEIKR